MQHVVKIYFQFGTAQLGLLQGQYRSRQEIRALCIQHLLSMGLLSQCELPPKELELLHVVSIFHMEYHVTYVIDKYHTQNFQCFVLVLGGKTSDGLNCKVLFYHSVPILSGTMISHFVITN